PAPPGSPARLRTWRPRRRWRLRRPGRPLRPAPRSYASLAPPYAGCGCVLAALVHRGGENGHATRPIGGRDSSRVDEGLILAGVRKVPHTVVANALSELESSLLLLGAPLCASEHRKRKLLARAHGP